MKSIPEAIAERRAQIHQLEVEVGQLESAALIIGAAVEKPVGNSVRKPIAAVATKVLKPKPAKAGGRPVESQKANYRCGHPRTPENSDVSTYVRRDGSKSTQCKTCRLVAHTKYREAKRAARPPAPAPAPLKVVVVAPQPEQKPAPHAAAAAKWKGQCPMLDSGTGKRCSLDGRHEGMHSASGRLFSAAAAVNVAAMGGSIRRELDEQALRGAAE